MDIETIETEHGLEYFIIYQINGVKASGARVVISRYLEQDAAKKYLNFCKEHYSEIYSSLYMSDEIVWVKN